MNWSNGCEPFQPNSWWVGLLQAPIPLLGLNGCEPFHQLVCLRPASMGYEGKWTSEMAANFFHFTADRWTYLAVRLKWFAVLKPSVLLPLFEGGETD